MIKVANNLRALTEKQALAGTATSALLHYLMAEEDAAAEAHKGALKGLGFDLGALTGYVGGNVAGGLAAATNKFSDPAKNFEEMRDRIVDAGYMGGGMGLLPGGIGGYLLARKLVEG
jgi:hypothetical protein